MTGFADVVALIARRADLLDVLADGAHAKRDLADAIDVSRSTLNRAVRDLEDAGLVARQDGEIELTLPGSVAYASYQNHVAELRGLDDAHDILAQYPGTLDLPPELFRDATTVEPNRHAPHRPVDALTEQLDDATHIRVYGTGLLPAYVETYHDLVGSGTRVESIVTTTVFRELVNEYGDVLEDVLATDNFALWETPEELPYSLVLVDDGTRKRVCLMLYSEHAVAGFVENDDASAVAWAESKLESLRANATRVGATR